MPTIVVSCSNGHRFPVNPEKHVHRDYRICPRCRETVRKEGLFHKDFQPDPNWARKKQERAELRRELKESRRPRHISRYPFPILNPFLQAIEQAYLELQRKTRETRQAEKLRQKTKALKPERKTGR